MSARSRPILLMLVSHYLPGFKAGGPIRSVANLVGQLSDEFDFRIIARDRDAGDAATYSGVQPNTWRHVGGARVRYVRPTFGAPVRIVREVGRVRPDAVYMNSFFDAKWCATPLALARFGSRGRTPTIIAPRGQFAEGALRFHAAKKKLYFAAFQSLGLTNRVIWQATSDLERDDIHRVIGRMATVVIAPNLSCVQPTATIRESKQPGRLNLAFFSRVSPKKNLAGALEFLATSPGSVRFDIWGPVEDPAYERRCRRQIAALPANVQVRWCGPAEPERVAEILSRYDAMLLPTFGENFGHAIVEALAAGCPVVISDRTPWRNLEANGAGWDLPLEHADAFRHALEMLCRMDETEHERRRRRAAQFAGAAVRTVEHVAAHRRMFELALNAGSSRDRRLPRAA